MSGHSKWSQIKRQKGVTDQKKGHAFTKLAAAITITVRRAGGVFDPNQNFKLRLAIEKARAMNMPKDNIERALRRAQGKLAGDILDEVTYEGFGQMGVAIIVEATTDNKLRTTSEIKSIFEKNGGTLGVPGCVSYQFEQKGLIIVKKNPSASSGQVQTIDDIFLIAADSGAEDVEEAGEEVLVYTKPDAVAKVKDALVSQGLHISEFELTRKPITTVRIEEKEVAQKVLSFLEKLENLEDVQKVYANYKKED